MTKRPQYSKKSVRAKSINRIKSNIKLIGNFLYLYIFLPTMLISYRSNAWKRNYDIQMFDLNDFLRAWHINTETNINKTFDRKLQKDEKSIIKL